MSELSRPTDRPLAHIPGDAADQSQASLADLGRLAAGVAHDFNNSLAVIVLHAQISLLQSDLSPTLRECLDTILDQAVRAGDLVHQLLEYGRDTTPERRPLCLGPFVAEQVRLFSRTLPENIALYFAEESAPYTVSISPTELQQVIVNLALNARDAMREGGELRFALDEVTTGESLALLPPDLPPGLPPDLPLDLPPGNWVRLRVSDTGSGIPSYVLPRLFEPFFTTKTARGYGLGLVQVQAIVQQCGGRINVTSEMGRGTTFALYFPAAAQVETRPEPAAADALTPGHGETVLVVEDDGAVRTALVISLEQLGYRPLEARNGREALALLLSGAQAVALVLSDITMPEMGGPALLQAIHDHKLAVPLVFLSGHSLEDVSLPPAEQYAGSLQKPVQLDALAKLLARVLALRP